MGDCGTIIKTSDGGTTWFAQLIPKPASLFSVYFTGADTGYAVGDNGVILKTTDGGGFPVGFPELSSGSIKMKIYPNPALAKITIETYPSPAKCQLSVMNLSGQQLLTYQITDPKTQLDISNLPGGVYFVRMTCDETVEMGKFIKQ